ncbi:adenylate/guanylate cyclase domain-containing protein [Marispirochaeta sp.]|uniref:adenylate/guanylate cyclase domain-containing protein n=1 Tax=Marispirochaeta sp. TaxID=2038653 RepID=UPI0029C6BADF|nr:adenylate/guanylate cyclase domain-containing protein [Marispirochaeta sp.]
MQRTIITITADPVNTTELVAVLESVGLGSFQTISAASMEEAEAHFYEQDIYLIIADERVPQAVETLREMKQDEMFAHIPVLLIIEKRTKERIQSAFRMGFDTCLAVQEVSVLLAHQSIPLIRNHLNNDDTMEKISDLQEKAIRDFILLDLIKDYIPRTIWNVAREYAHEQRIRIPEEERTLTIVFGDIKDFTPKTQKMQPKNVIRYLNSAFDVVSRLVYSHDGDIDKYIGDAFLAVFNDPVRAVRSMLTIQKEFEVLNRERSSRSEDVIIFRVGVHTGPVIRGNVGGSQRFDNTLIGDTVNTAARLEKIAEPGGILISEATRQALGLELPEECGRLENLKGRTGNEKVWSIYEHLKNSPIAHESAAL